MLETEKADLYRGTERRHKFIESRPFCGGHMNRGLMTNGLGVSVKQASLDLNHSDGSARTGIKDTQFEPLILKTDAMPCLLQLRSIADGILDRADAWIGEFPSDDAAPAPARAVNPEVLARRTSVTPS